MENGLEVDFLAVNSGEKSGDAIAFRYGNLEDPAKQMVIVIDGGTLESGKNLVKLIKEAYNTNYVDLVICTHPDADHASGLREVLNVLSVGELWIHKPWEHSEHISHLFHDGRITDNSLSQRIRDEYNFAHELVEIAESNKVNIREPFAGLKFGNGEVEVLGPSVDYYRELLPNFARTPETKESIFENTIRGFATKAVQWVEDALHIELLDEFGVTSAENSSSAVCLLHFDGNKYLFTGDSGVESLKKVIEYANNNGIDLTNLYFLQVPHHGSKRNVSPIILNAIKGEVAYVSASKDAPKHPSKKVLNALKKRGTRVYSTEGTNLISVHNRPMRPGYSTINPHVFYDKVEE